MKLLKRKTFLTNLSYKTQTQLNKLEKFLKEASNFKLMLNEKSNIKQQPLIQTIYEKGWGANYAIDNNSKIIIIHGTTYQFFNKQFQTKQQNTNIILLNDIQSGHFYKTNFKYKRKNSAVQKTWTYNIKTVEEIYSLLPKNLQK